MRKLLTISILACMPIQVASASNPQAELGPMHNAAVECVFQHDATGSVHEAFSAMVNLCDLGGTHTVEELSDGFEPIPEGFRFRTLIETRGGALNTDQGHVVDSLDAMLDADVASVEQFFSTLDAIEADALVRLSGDDPIDDAILAALAVAPSSGQLWMDLEVHHEGLPKWAQIALADAAGALVETLDGGSGSEIAQAAAASSLIVAGVLAVGG